MNKKTLLSIRDLKVQFRVRGRILTAIRGISLDIYENECIAIVGESGSGKSVFTKTFAGMLDSNGFVSEGSLEFFDEDLAAVQAPKNESTVASLCQQLNESAKLEAGAEIWKEILNLESEKKAREEDQTHTAQKQKELTELRTARINLFNRRQTLDPKREKAQLAESKKQLRDMDRQIRSLEAEIKKMLREAKSAAASDTAYLTSYNQKMADLKAKHAAAIQGQISQEQKSRNEILAKEVYLSVYRCPQKEQAKKEAALLKDLKEAMRLGVDLTDDGLKDKIFEETTFRVALTGEEGDQMTGICHMNLAKIHSNEDWMKIRGRKIATVFQDPMTSLNPIITIGKQITSIIIKHQGCTEAEARTRALTLMAKVGIPHPENRFDDYPFQYSGGMRQRIVIAIALSCQPKILICDEPTTALDVTIQAQILQLIKDLQKEFGYTTVFITHDLGVVANVADRVGVLYAGQLVELGTVEEIFYEPRHPYTWALLSSLPQLAEKNTTLYSITGTPPSLYNEVKGDAFAPRNPYCMKIDTLKEPPMFQVSETHFAKTWLLHPDAPAIEKPEGIHDIHGKLMKAFNI